MARGGSPPGRGCLCDAARQTAWPPVLDAPWRSWPKTSRAGRGADPFSVTGSFVTDSILVRYQSFENCYLSGATKASVTRQYAAEEGLRDHVMRMTTELLNNESSALRRSFRRRRQDRCAASAGAPVDRPRARAGALAICPEASRRKGAHPGTRARANPTRACPRLRRPGYENLAGKTWLANGRSQPAPGAPCSARAARMTARMRATAASRPVKMASPTRKWPMLNSTISGIRATGTTDSKLRP